MEFLITLFTAVSVIGIAILIWFGTKSGKKWLRDL